MCNIFFGYLYQHIHYVFFHCIIVIHGKTHLGVLDLVLLYGASNVQNYCTILSVMYLHITVGHGAEKHSLPSLLRRILEDSFI